MNPPPHSRMTMIAPYCGQQCWGVNTDGQLGLGDNVTRGDSIGLLEMGNNLTSINLGKGQTVESMGLGDSHTCAVLTGGAVKVRSGGKPIVRYVH